jgi:CRISPR-associated endonuclease/helicase Cas3
MIATDRDTELRAAFSEIFGGSQLFSFQLEVARHILNGRSVILQAPTGAGKTRAALFPFLYGWRNPDPTALPRQCVYVIPLRVLADQFSAEYSPRVAEYARTHTLPMAGEVRVQTGALAEDPRFEGDLTFTTVDQFLSSFLTIPYSLGNRSANLNAGALIGSYLVFDEFHLFPVDKHGQGALATTVHVLQMLKGITPFLLMTATFSRTMLDHLCRELDAEAVTLTQAEVAAIPSQQGKQRRYRYVSQPLTADAVANDLLQHQRQRAIAVCNTVDCARQLATDLKADDRLAGVRIELLHSQFYPSDRAAKEEDIRREFGEERNRRQWGPTILVATQVIEVGLNITCDALHTELAPASAIVQRAGRCARFVADKYGLVLVYDVPVDTAGRPNYAPYIDSGRSDQADGADREGQSKLCERTQIAFAQFPAEGRVLQYHDEVDLVSAVHEPFDAALLRQVRDGRHNLRETIEGVFATHERNKARSLIRDIDSRTVIVHHRPAPDTIPNPYRHEGISLRRNALLAWYSNDELHDRANTLELDWIVQLPVAQDQADNSGPEGPERRQHVETRWLPCRPTIDRHERHEGCNQIAASPLIVVNPALVQYDTTLGFRFGGETPAPDSPIAPYAGRARQEFGPLHRETYAQHIAGLHRYYQRKLLDRTAAVHARLEARHGLAPGTLDRAIRLMFAIHDLGKLDRRWQGWAHAWQERVSQIRKDDLRIDADYMAAHTDYDSRDLTERNAESSIQPRRPAHAAESAAAGKALLAAFAGDCEALYAALVSAIVCHHGSTIRTEHDEWKPITPHAKAAFNEAMRAVGLGADPALHAALLAVRAGIPWQQGFVAANDLGGDVIKHDRPSEVILYLLLVRILRLADQGSQEEKEVAE